MSVQGLELFNIFGGDTVCRFIQFADDTKLSGAAGTAKEGDNIQLDFNRLERGVHAKLRKINKAKCKSCSSTEAIPNMNTGWDVNRQQLCREGLWDPDG